MQSWMCVHNTYIVSSMIIMYCYVCDYFNQFVAVHVVVVSSAGKEILFFMEFQ